MSQLEIKFLGAAGTVTGSRTLVNYRKTQFLVDCGLFQGVKALRERNWEPFPVDPHRLEAVVLTHAHLDHSGYLPRLVRGGFKSPIYCSKGTADLLKVLLLDSAKIQEEDAKYANTTGHSRHKPALPLYTRDDVDKVLDLVKTIEDNEWNVLFDGVSCRPIRAGHIVGARSLEFNFAFQDKSKLVTFSGDVGHERMKTLRGPQPPSETDVLILEATYGDRDHEKVDPMSALEEVIRDNHQKGGVLVIPAFAVGRAQEMIYMIRLLEDEKRIPSTTVILDSPMSSKATDIYLKHKSEHKLGLDFDTKNKDNFFPEQFETVEGPDESLHACMMEGPLVVISAAGMLSGGRVLHHLKSRLPHAKNTVLFAGYQAEGTKGRYLQDKGALAGSLRIHHQEVAVHAEIKTIPALSAHGDAEDLLQWLASLKKAPQKVYLNHAESEAAEGMKWRILRQHPDWDIEIASENETIKLA